MVKGRKTEKDGEHFPTGKETAISLNQDGPSFPVRVEDSKPEVSKNENELAQVATVKDEVNKGRKLLTIQDIIDALSIIVHSSRNIVSERRLDFISLKDMVVEMAAEVDAMPPELIFMGAFQGRWCIMYNQIRFSKCTEEEISEYLTLMKHLHHVLEGTAKEFFRIFRISQKVNQGTRQILDPTYLGLDKSVLTIPHEMVRNMPIENWELFRYINQGEYDEHLVFLHPSLHALHMRTQDHLVRDNVELRRWMEEFTLRKLITLR